MNTYATGNFAQLPPKERMRYSGQDSEEAAERYFASNKYQYQRFGLCNSSMKEILQIPMLLRMRPDYICNQFGVNNFYVEVKACGNQGLKIKLESIKALWQWKQTMPVMIFIHHGVTKQFAFIAFGKLVELSMGLKVFTWDDGKEYYRIECSALNWQTPLPIIPTEVYGY